MSDNYPVDGELRRQAERIEALEQAHAELAAKVDALTERLTAISILADRMDDLHARVLAYDETCGQIHNSHIARHNDLACKIERLFGLDKNTSDRLSALESPAPAPDPVCLDCGHPKSDHTPNGIVCQRDQSNPEGPHCHCHGYIDPGWKPRMEPAPLDPVEAIETQAYLYGSSRYWQGVVIKSGEDPSDATSKMLKEWDTLVEMIRAYGRDGGR